MNKLEDLSKEELIAMITDLQKEKTILVDRIVNVRNICNDYAYPKENALECLTHFSKYMIYIIKDQENKYVIYLLEVMYYV